MAAYDDLKGMVTAAGVTGYTFRELWQEESDAIAGPVCLIRRVQGLASTEDTRRWVYRIAFYGAANADAATVSGHAEQAARYILDNFTRGGVILARMVLDTVGPYQTVSSRPYYYFELSIYYANQ
jgi:hypothetical protein